VSILLRQRSIMTLFPEAVMYGSSLSSSWYLELRTYLDKLSPAASTRSSTFVADSQIGRQLDEETTRHADGPQRSKRRMWALKWRLTERPAATEVVSTCRVNVQYMDRAQDLMTSSTCVACDWRFLRDCDMTWRTVVVSVRGVTQWTWSQLT